MKIRCGSHQQNRSIVRPGLSLMAAKVALTAEEFRENSQRSIDLFNTEKLSTDSTRVLKSVYCNSVHFCRCNLHGACGGKEGGLFQCQTPSGCNLHGACGGKVSVMLWMTLPLSGCNLHGACGGKGFVDSLHKKPIPLQSARSVWRQRWMPARLPATERSCCNLHGACGGKEVFTPLREQKRRLQSARSVWRQRGVMDASIAPATVAICTERVEAKLK